MIFRSDGLVYKNLQIIDDLDELDDNVVVRPDEKVKKGGKILGWYEPDDSYRINSNDPDDFSWFEPTWCDICQNWDGLIGQCRHSRDRNVKLCDHFECNEGV